MPDRATTVPDRLAGALPSSEEKFEEFASRVYEDGAVDRKTKELIAFASAWVGRSRPAVDRHAEKARSLGAGEQELAETLAVARVQSGGTQVVWMKEHFEDVLGESWRQDLIGEADRAFWDFKREVYSSGVLPEKSKHLVAVAVNSMLRCPHCTRAHMQAAFDADASRREVAEALAVLWAVGSEIQAGWYGEGLQRHVHAG